MTDQPENVRYRDVMGVLREREFTIGNEVVLPGAALPARIVEDEGGRRMIQKFVPLHFGERNPGFYDLLDREIRAGTRLGQVFGTRHPNELPALVGYNTDLAEPFVLFGEYRGQPAAQSIGRFDDGDRRRFEVGLLRALQHTAVADVIHGAVSMDVLRWDGATVQLVDFESAERAGEARRRGGRFPARSREQVEGTGQADARDDMWAAGLVIRELTMGPSTSGTRLDLSRDPERLRVFLQGVFDDSAEARPHAVTLLTTLRADISVSIAPDLDAALTEGRQLFERASMRKRPHPAQPEPEHAERTERTERMEPTEERAVPQAGVRPAWLVPFLAVLLLAAVAVIVALVINL